MSNNVKTALLAVISVVAALALIFVGTLLSAAIPEVDSAAQSILGNDTGTSSSDGTSAQLDAALQDEILQKLNDTFYEPVDADILNRSAIGRDARPGVGRPLLPYYYDSRRVRRSRREDFRRVWRAVGMVLMMRRQLVTVYRCRQSPAAEAELRTGDIVVSVAGVTTQGRTLMEIVSDIKGEEGTEVQLEMYRPAVPASTTTTTLSGDEDADTGTGTVTTESKADTVTVDLSRLPEGGASTTYTLTRRSIVVPTTSVSIVDDDGLKVAHIIFSTFASQKAAEELRSVVESAISKDGVDAIVLDVRGNGGGFLDQAVKVASIFIKSGVIVSTEGLHFEEEVYNAAGNALPDVPLYLLVGEYSASASEILAGALQDYGRATLVGETTFGKGLVQTIEPLSNGGAVKVTTAIYLTPKGRDINETGIVPDVVAPDDPATEDVDETLERALELIASAE